MYTKWGLQKTLSDAKFICLPLPVIEYKSENYGMEFQ